MELIGFNLKDVINDYCLYALRVAFYKRFIACCFCLFAGDIQAQDSNLIVFLQFQDYDADLQVSLVLHGDTVQQKRLKNVEDYAFENLKSGEYEVIVVNASATSGALVFSCIVKIEENKDYSCFFTGYETSKTTKSYSRSDDSADTFERTEIQVALNYGHSDFIEMGELRSHFSIREEGYAWKPFTKHIGRMVGGGISFGQYFFDKDKFSPSESFQVLRKKYNAWDLDVKYLLRFTQKNQLVRTNASRGFVLDIGIGYYLPLVFRLNTAYENDVHLIQTRMHQFNDFRGIVNFGFHPFVFTAEYRVFDFVQNEHQLPKLEFGIKFLIVDSSH
jgi:hypothetical protein